MYFNLPQHFNFCPLLLSILGIVLATSIVSQQHSHGHASQVDIPTPEKTEEPTVEGPLGNRIDEYLQNAELFGFDGVVLVEHQGKLVLHKGYGYANREEAKRHQVSTVFDVGSIAKMFTGAVIMRLVEEGTLELNSKLRDLLPNVPADKQNITIRQLLSHTSGLSRSLGSTEQNESPSSVVRRILESELALEVGKEYRYSNMGFTLLAAIVEKNSTDGWKSELMETVGKAGLMSTGFYQTVEPEQIAHCYLEQDYAGTAADWQFNWGKTGNGNLLSTTGDLLKWVKALESAKVISSATWKTMTSSQVEIEPDQSSYGLGVNLETNANSPNSIGHSGDYIGYHCVLIRYPETQSTIIVCCNEGFVYSGLGNHRIVQSGLQSMLRGEEPRRMFPKASVPEILKNREGRYFFDEDDFVRVNQNNGRTWISAHGKVASQALLGLDTESAERCDNIWERTEQLLSCVDNGEREQAKTLAGNNFGVNTVTKILDGNKSNWRILAAKPVTWTRSNVTRVFVEIPGTKRRVISLGWDEAELFDITEWDHQFPHRVPLAATANDEHQLLTCDPWTKHTNHFEFRGEKLVFKHTGKTLTAVRE